MEGVLSGWGGAVKASTVGERVERALGHKNRRRRTAELLEVLRHAFRQLSRDGALARSPLACCLRRCLRLEQ